MPADPQVPTDAEYLTDARREQMLVGTLMGLFQVESAGARRATLKVGGQAVFSTGAPDNRKLKEQMIWLRNYADLRSDRIGEITVQMTDILSFFGAVAPIVGRNKRHTLALLSAVQTICVYVELQLKHFCWAPRPVQFAPEVQPIIPTPDHSSFPSGHSTEAFAIATVLNHFMSGGKDAAAGVATWDMPYRVAHRIAVNRTVAGVHFPIDSAAGALFGCTIGDAICGVAAGQKKFAMRTFDARGFSSDFVPKWLQGAIAAAGAVGPVACPEFLARHWAAARSEWPR
jgi:membrane-associated phospholipid phosphatase